MAKVAIFILLIIAFGCTPPPKPLKSLEHCISAADFGEEYLTEKNKDYFKRNYAMKHYFLNTLLASEELKNQFLTELGEYKGKLAYDKFMEDDFKKYFSIDSIVDAWKLSIIITPDYTNSNYRMYINPTLRGINHVVKTNHPLLVNYYNWAYQEINSISCGDMSFYGLNSDRILAEFPNGCKNKLCQAELICPDPKH